MPTPAELERARRAVARIGIDASALVDTLAEVHGDGYMTGAHAGLAVLPGMGEPVAPKFNDDIDWDSWEPGNAPAAAELLGTDGGRGLRTLLAESKVAIRGISEFTMERLARELAAGVDVGESKQDLTKRLTGVLGDKKRAETVARTEVARAQTAATLDVYASNGMGGKKWLASRDAEEHCRRLNGKVWTLNDPLAPRLPLHPRCRCSFTPVLASEMAAPVSLLPRAKTLPHDAAGLTLEQFKAAKRALPKLKASVRAKAADVQAETQRALELADIFEMAPPYARGSKEARATGVYDWFYALHPNEQARLRGAWMKGKRQTANPDLIADRLKDAYGIDDFDEAMARWLEETRRYDLAGLLSRGKLPNPSRYGGQGFDIDGVFGDGTFHVADLFDSDQRRALRSVAASTETQAEEFAIRAFVKPSDGRLPPWKMSEADYIDEITDVDAKVSLIKPIRTDPDFGPEFSSEDAAMLRRFDELVPPELEGAGTMTGPELHQAVIDLARKAGLIDG